MKAHSGTVRVPSMRKALVLGCLIFASNVFGAVGLFAQDSLERYAGTNSVRLLPFSKTAWIASGKLLSLGSKALIFADAPGPRELSGSAIVAIDGIAQLEVTRERTVASPSDIVDPLMCYGVKVRLLGGEREGLAVSAYGNASAVWSSSGSNPGMQGSTAISSSQWGSITYRNSFHDATGGIVISKTAWNTTSFHAGLELRQLTLRHERYWRDSLFANVHTSFILENDLLFQLNGHFGMIADLSERESCSAEIQTLPEVFVVNGPAPLTIRRALRAALGIRHRLKNTGAVYSELTHTMMASGSPVLEVRFGAEIDVSLQ